MEIVECVRIELGYKLNVVREVRVYLLNECMIDIVHCTYIQTLSISISISLLFAVHISHFAVRCYYFLVFFVCPPDLIVNVNI